MIISKASLEEILACRELRAETQRALLAHHRSVACFTMNIPGEIKHTPLIEFAFRHGVAHFEALLPAPAKKIIACAPTGCEAFFAFDIAAGRIKHAALAVEEGGRVGRLYDIDVLDDVGEKLSRGEERRCIVCGGPVRACARSRAHGLEELLLRVDSILCEFAAQKLAGYAHDALLLEVNATPKPGLVDRANCGAHRDMDLSSFHRSAAAIRPYFENMVRLALNGYAREPEALMQTLRAQGLAAERAMLFATGGANAHKGAIFSMGLILAGVAISLKTEEKALIAAERLARIGLADALAAARGEPATNGERIYQKTGALGARGEAAKGFPAAREAQKALAGFLDQGYSLEDAAVLTLPTIMETLEDTNLLHRGGEESLRFAQRSAAHINALPPAERMAALCALDGAFIARNLSPGGCADVLALALLFHALEAHVVL